MLNLDSPQVMGILNVTPDSFYDGGYFSSQDKALKQALQMIDEGAAIIDIGGESTRPFAETISIQEELDRVLPVIQALRKESDIPISIDTTKVEVMREAVKAGASFLNDINALGDTETLIFAAEQKLPVCLMHRQGSPQTMQLAPNYTDVVRDVTAFLRTRVQAAVEAGVPREKLMVDPGIGFGKNLHHNLRLLQSIKELHSELGLPLLIGTSRKAMIGEILNVLPEERLYGSLALAAWAFSSGVTIVRAHDVKPTVHVMKLIKAVMQGDWHND